MAKTVKFKLERQFVLVDTQLARVRIGHFADFAVMEGLSNLNPGYYRSSGGAGSSGYTGTGTGMRMERGAPPNSTRTDIAISSLAPGTYRNVPPEGLPSGARRGRVLSGRVLRRGATPGAVPPRRSRIRDVSLFKRTRSWLILILFMVCFAVSGSGSDKVTVNVYQLR